MQCLLRIDALDDNGHPYWGSPLGNTHIISSITEHPDITDAWDAFAALLSAIASSVAAGLAGGGVAAGPILGATASWIGNQVKSGMDKKYGDAKRIRIPAGAAYWLPNSANPIVDWGSQLRVSFRAWSEDEIKQGAEKHIEQPPGVNARFIDEHGGYHQTDGTYYWDWSFIVPLRDLPVGVYTISFVAADDGWFFDVGLTEVLVIEVDQNPYPRQTGTPVSHATFDPKALQDAMRAIDQLHKLPPSVRSIPKRTSQRLDGRASVPIKVAAAISFNKQKPSPLAKNKAATVL